MIQKKREKTDKSKKQDEETIREEYRKIICAEADVKDWQNKVITFDQSRDIANHMQKLRGEPNYHFEVFKDMKARIDLDNNDEITLEEMIAFDRDMQSSYDDLVIAIYWVGFAIKEDDLITNPDYWEEFKTTLELNETAKDSELYRHFEITYDGQPLCINEYATWIAEESNTHVIQIADHFEPKDEFDDFTKRIHILDIERDYDDKKFNNAVVKNFVVDGEKHEYAKLLKTRTEGRSRHYFFNDCGTEHLYQAL